MDYWVKVEFENGKILNKDGMTLNESYSTLCRYRQNRHRVKVKSISLGRGNNETGYLCP